MAKGNFIEYVVSDNPNKYPNDGEQGGYYYELYGGPKTLISFTIDGTSYQSDPGMPWETWCDSNYNTGGYYVGFGPGATAVVTASSNQHYGKYVVVINSSGDGPVEGYEYAYGPVEGYAYTTKSYDNT